MILGHSTDFWLNPLWGAGYQFWSGIGSDLGEIVLIGMGWAFLRKHNCHVKSCWRLSWHAHPEHGHQVCRKHHPHGEGIAG